MRRPVWSKRNLKSSVGVEELKRRGAQQTGDYTAVDPQPDIMIVVIDESDPHANQRDSSTVTYGVLYTLRTDDIRDKDQFWFQPPGGQRFLWGVVGPGRWNIDHAMTDVNFGVQQFRIRKGG